jgi:hypothetical protein
MIQFPRFAWWKSSRTFLSPLLSDYYLCTCLEHLWSCTKMDLSWSRDQFDCSWLDWGCSGSTKNQKQKYESPWHPLMDGWMNEWLYFSVFQNIRIL